MSAIVDAGRLVVRHHNLPYGDLLPGRWRTACRGAVGDTVVDLRHPR